MIKKISLLFAMLLVSSISVLAQDKDAVIDAIIQEANENSQLETLGHQLMDGIGPRLVGTPQMKNAHDWAVKKYESWGIPARNEQWGEWKGWERGITHIDMVHPRVHSLRGTQLAWSPNTPKKGVTAELVVLPMVSDSLEFVNWLPNVKGKLVMISMPQPTGRPDYNWEEFATEKSFEKMKKEREEQTEAWRKNIANTGLNRRTLPVALEEAGAVGIVASYWSRGFGVNKIFGAYTKEIPTVDLELEDYGMLYRLVESGQKPKLHIVAESKELGKMPTIGPLKNMKVGEFLPATSN
ncbi:MAG TPA: hypothetical protein VJ880_09925, partial [Allomuricauda sp.]|nr:hypothetical protein [Allomuricauda sp.]